MAWCKKCSANIVWYKEGNKWVPLEGDLKNSNFGKDHRPVCKEDPVYIAKRKILIKDMPLQIDENTFV